VGVPTFLFPLRFRRAPIRCGLERPLQTESFSTMVFWHTGLFSFPPFFVKEPSLFWSPCSHFDSESTSDLFPPSHLAYQLFHLEPYSYFPDTPLRGLGPPTTFLQFQTAPDAPFLGVFLFHALWFPPFLRIPLYSHVPERGNFSPFLKVLQ